MNATYFQDKYITYFSSITSEFGFLMSGINPVFQFSPCETSINL
jgi:hypothetical protein